jgi:hypothetical protein
MQTTQLQRPFQMLKTDNDLNWCDCLALTTIQTTSKIAGLFVVCIIRLQCLTGLMYGHKSVTQIMAELGRGSQSELLSRLRGLIWWPTLLPAFRQTVDTTLSFDWFRKFCYWIISFVIALIYWIKMYHVCQYQRSASRLWTFFQGNCAHA